MDIIGLKILSKIYNYGEAHLRTILCRPEFNKYRAKFNFRFVNCDEFHEDLKKIIRLKAGKKCIILFLFFLNTQIAYCQHYEPIIIYNPNGEPQTILKGRIIYDNYGVPKFNIQTKRSVSCFYRK